MPGSASKHWDMAKNSTANTWNLHSAGGIQVINMIQMSKDGGKCHEKNSREKENNAEKIDEKCSARSTTLNMTVNEGLKNEVILGERSKVEKGRNHLGSKDLSRQREDQE